MFIINPYYVIPGTVFPISFQEAGAGVSRGSTGTLTPAFPVTGLAADDIFILHVSISSATGVVDTAVTGFTHINSYQIGSADTGEHAVFWKRATGSESGNATVSFSTDVAVVKTARMYRFRGCIASGTPYEGLGNAQANSATLADQSVTSTGANRLAVNLYTINDDNAVDAFTGQTGGTWVEPVAEFTTLDGNDSCLGIQTAQLVSAGTINGGSFTMAGADPFSIVGFALIPA